MLSNGRAPIFEAGLEDAIVDGLGNGSLRFTTDPTPGPDAKTAIVCVPTPSTAAGLLDTGLVEMVVARLLGELPADGTIAVRSTLPLHGPDRLDAIAGQRPIDRPAIIINPEFMREGRALADFSSPSRVAVGYLQDTDRGAAESFAGVYAPFGAPTVIADARSIVLAKLASNVFLSTKVAFANEIARLCDALGADVGTVMDVIGLDPRIGRAFLDAGPGFGGSCLPEQAEAIAVEAADRRIEAPLLSAIARSNTAHQKAIVAAVEGMLDRGLRGARVALLGLAFKANTDDVRRSPALVIARELRARGANVIAYDPVAEATARRVDPELLTASSAADAISGADAVIVATEWAEFGALDWRILASSMRGDLVYDARRALHGDGVRAAGLRYVALGLGLRPANEAVAAR
jgi:UDPglucose 6-dehydrogenase